MDLENTRKELDKLIQDNQKYKQYELIMSK